MHELLQRLGRGDTRLIEMCQQANRTWANFLEELSTADTGTLAARLQFFEPEFKRIFESDTLGPTMMPWTGFATLYDIEHGWGENKQRALQLAQAFALSHCSQEVKSEARSAVISYEIEDALPPPPPPPEKQRRRGW
jgi:hypothetical protein